MIRVRMSWRGCMPLITLLTMLLIGCGTMHHFVPPAPPRLDAGEVEATIGITWSPHAIYPWTIQATGYLALGANDFLGIGVCNFFIPGTISYVHYRKIGNASWLSYQLHCNHILSDSFDPAWEADLGLGSADGEFQQTAKLGIAYFGRAPFPIAGTFLGAHSGVTPVAGYDAWYASVGASVEVYPGMTSHFLRASQKWAWPWGHDDSDTISRFVGPPRTIALYDTLLVIDSIVSEQPTRFGWRFTRADGTIVALERPSHPTYGMEWGSPAMATSALLRNFIERESPPIWALYTLDSALMRSILSDSSPPRTINPSRAWASPRYFRLDAEKAVAEYHATGRLTLRDDLFIDNRMLSEARCGLDDITIGIGFRRNYTYR